MGKTKDAKKLAKKQRKAEEAAAAAKAAKKLAKKRRKAEEAALAAEKTATADRLSDRQKIIATADEVDRSDEAAVAAWNAAHGKATGHFLTSEAELAAERAKLAAPQTETERRVELSAMPIGKLRDFAEGDYDIDWRGANKAEVIQQILEHEGYYGEGAVAAKSAPAAADPEPAAEEPKPAKKSKKKPEPEPVAEDTEPEPAAEESKPAASAFMKPSDARPDCETDEELLRRGEKFNGLGQRLIILPDQEGVENPQMRGYTRATSYISALEDTAGLAKWRERLVLEGADLVQLEASVERARATLLEAEGDLDDRINSGELEGLTKTARAEIVDAPGKEYRRELARIGEAAFDAAGGRDAAEYGTALHTLMEHWLDESDDLAAKELTFSERWPEIIRDFEALQIAYEAFVAKTGARVVGSEVLVVNDKLRVAGRLDLIIRCILPGDERTRAIIADLKTGDVSNELKLAQQLSMYASSRRYNPETGERSSLRVRADWGLVIHVPRGQARARFFLVDLAAGRAANVLCGKVRESRRKVPGITQAVDLTPGE